MEHHQKHIIALLGPSGAGKDKLCEELKAMGIPLLKSNTTREMREGEGYGNPYYFMSKEDFDKYEYIQKVLLYGDWYGMPVVEAEGKLISANKVCVVLAEKGVRQFREIYGNMVSVFYIQCTHAEALGRMLARGDSISQAHSRLKKDIHLGRYKSQAMADYVIHNHDGQFVEAFRELKSYIENL